MIVIMTPEDERDIADELQLKKSAIDVEIIKNIFLWLSTGSSKSKETVECILCDLLRTKNWNASWILM